MAKKIKFTQKQIKSLISDYKSGISLRKLEIKYNHCRRVLSKILKENDVLIKNNSINSRKYSHDEDYFEVIDTEEKAYWLGFMYADGFIESKRKNQSQKFGITLNKIDYNHLKKFKKCIQATNPIKTYIGGGYTKNSVFSKILITSQKTVDDLKDKGVVENKTNILKFPTEEQVPKELIPHFIRGYFDGDGCICYYYQKEKYKTYQINFVGTKDFIDGLKSYLKLDLKCYTKNNVTYQLNVGGNNKVKKIMNMFYKNAKIFLDRKHEKYLEMLKYSES